VKCTVYLGMLIKRAEIFFVHTTLGLSVSIDRMFIVVLCYAATVFDVFVDIDFTEY
jgi:hypothetical protein